MVDVARGDLVAGTMSILMALGGLASAVAPSRQLRSGPATGRAAVAGRRREQDRASRESRRRLRFQGDR